MYMHAEDHTRTGRTSLFEEPNVTSSCAGANMTMQTTKDGSHGHNMQASPGRIILPAYLMGQYRAWAPSHRWRWA